MLLLLAGCQCPPSPPDTEESPPEPIEITSIEIVPEKVHLAEGLQVQLVARLRDQNNHIVPELAGFVPTWEWNMSEMPPEVVTGTLVAFTVQGHRGVATAPTVTADAAVPLRATVNGWSADAELIVTVALQDDFILVEQDPTFHVAAIALVDGLRGTCVNDLDGSPLSFVAAVGLGNFTSDCDPADNVTGEVAVFSSVTQMGFRRVIWQTGPDEVDFSSSALDGSPHERIGQELGPPLVVELKVWYPEGPPSEGREAQVLDEVHLASDVFRSNRAGVVLLDDPETASGVLEAVLVAPSSGSVWDCADVQTRLPQLPPGAWAADKLNVVYVMRLTDDPDGTDENASWSGYRGYTCPISDVYGAVILIDWQARDQYTLAHELGHLFALTKPPLPLYGHTAFIGGFKESDNLMLTYMSDESWIPRENLSLGQMFRINVDDASWINTGSVRGATQIIDPPGVQCQCDPYGAIRCPKLSLNVAAVSTDVQSVGCP